MNTTNADATAHDPVPKLLGADVELANFLPGRSSPDGTGAIAARRLLREIDGFPGKPEPVVLPIIPPAYGIAAAGGRTLYGDGTTWRPPVADSSESYPISRDWGRRFLVNGGCAYIDLNHLEVCTAETLDAREHVAALRAMLEIARCAQESANAGREPRDRITVIANNSDGQGNSYGSHMSVCMQRRVFDELLNRRLHHLLFLASYQVSSIIFTGQGKVGSENNTPPCDYQIAQRADFFETLIGHQTTHTRPVINLRDEALVGWKNAGAQGRTSAAERLARLHIIFYDNALCQTACFLRAGVMQIVLAMIERGHVDPSLILDDPVEAVVAWSHDPELEIRVPLMSGNRDISAVEWQLRFAERVSSFVASGACEGIVPNAGGILDLYTDTIEKLHARRFDDLAPRIDWILKRIIVGRALESRGLGWYAPEAKHLDQMYGSLEDGLFWRLEETGHVERIVGDAEIERLIHLPPSNTRAWRRGMILRTARPETIDSVDWDLIRVRDRASAYDWGTNRLIRLDDPFCGATESKPDAQERNAPQQLQREPDCSTGQGAPAAPPPPSPQTADLAAAIPHQMNLMTRVKKQQKRKGTRHGKPN